MNNGPLSQRVPPAKKSSLDVLLLADVLTVVQFSQVFYNYPSFLQLSSSCSTISPNFFENFHFGRSPPAPPNHVIKTDSGTALHSTTSISFDVEGFRLSTFTRFSDTTFVQ